MTFFNAEIAEGAEKILHTKALPALSALKTLFDYFNLNSKFLINKKCKPYYFLFVLIRNQKISIRR